MHTSNGSRVGTTLARQARVRSRWLNTAITTLITSTIYHGRPGPSATVPRGFLAGPDPALRYPSEKGGAQARARLQAPLGTGRSRSKLEEPAAPASRRRLIFLVSREAIAHYEYLRQAFQGEEDVE